MFTQTPFVSGIKKVFWSLFALGKGVTGVAKKMDVDLAKKGIVLVEVNGKPNIKNYSDYLSSFGIPHVVTYDIDDPDAPLNQTIESLSVWKVRRENGILGRTFSLDRIRADCDREIPVY